MFTKREEIARKTAEFLERLTSCPACQLEGQQLEVKGWCSGTKDLSGEIGEAAVCLANAEGGLVIVGVSNKYTAPTCFKPRMHRDVNPDWVEERISVLTTPPVFCRAFTVKELLGDKADPMASQVIVLAVPKTSSVELPKFQGVCYKRKDDKCPVEYTTSADDFSDIVIPGAQVEDLDPSATLQAMGQAQNATRYGIGQADFLRNARLMRMDPRVDPEREMLTVAGLLLVGKPTSIAKHMPHAQVAFTYLGVSGVSEGGRTETLNIAQAVTRFTNQLQEEVNLDAETLREVIVNALVHRDYRARSVVEITISPKDVTFQNPGSLLGGLTPSNLLRAHPIYRNFRLAEAARQAGLCRKFGDGIDRIFYNCLASGYDFPFIEVSPDSFSIKFSRTANTAFAKMLRARAETLDNLDRIIVMKWLQVRGTATLSDLSLALQRSSFESEKILAEMVKTNIVEQCHGGYRLSPSVVEDISSFEPEKRQLRLW